MRHLVWTTSILAISLALGCGDAESAEPRTDESTSGNNDPTASIVYPDSHCTEDGCVANSDAPKTCDPNSGDPELGDCDAWRINGTFSLSAAKIDSSAERGRPPKPSRMDSDLCPPNMTTPKDKTEHCCQRVTEQAEQPAFILSGMSLNDPVTFRGSSVGTTNKEAIEDDRYIWIMQLSSNKPGKVTVKSGLGLQNTDGSYAFAEGPFELGGQMWNKKGEWDPHVVDGTLAEDGTLSYVRQYVPEGRYFQLPLWGSDYSFSMMVLSMTGIEMTIKLDADKLCAGYLKGFSDFNQIGQLKGYLPLEPLREVDLHFEKDDPGIRLCSIAAQVNPADCDKPVKDWGK